MRMLCHDILWMRARKRAGGFGQGCARCEAAGQPRWPLALVMASGVTVAGAGLGVGIGGERSVIRDAAQWERRTAVAAESSSGEKTAAMSPRNHAHGGEKTRKYSRDGAWGVLAGCPPRFCA